MSTRRERRAITEALASTYTSVVDQQSLFSPAMDGCQLTFFLRQNQTVNHLPFVDWLLEQVRKRHIRGATVVSCSDGIDHLGKRHAARFFELADQPVEIVLAVTDEEADMLLSIVRESGAHVFYTRCPVQFESIGPV